MPGKSEKLNIGDIIKKEIDNAGLSSDNTYTDNFLPDIKDMFTDKKYNYTGLVTEIYEKMKASDTVINNAHQIQDLSHIQIKDLELEKNEFMALLTVEVYEQIKDKIKSRSTDGECLSLIRTLNFEIANDKKITEYKYPVDCKTALGGEKEKQGLTTCGCGIYYKQDSESGSITNVDFICIQRDPMNPTKISSIGNVICTENATIEENNIGTKCVLTKRMNPDEYTKTKNKYCDLHNMPIKLKNNWCTSIDDYIIERRDVLLSEIVNHYLDTTNNQHKENEEYKDEIKEQIISEFKGYSKDIYKQLIDIREGKQTNKKSKISKDQLIYTG